VCERTCACACRAARMRGFVRLRRSKRRMLGQPVCVVCRNATPTLHVVCHVHAVCCTYATVTCSSSSSFSCSPSRPRVFENRNLQPGATVQALLTNKGGGRFTTSDAPPCHIRTGTGLTPCHICTGTALAPCHICTRTRLAPCTSTE
jgi:hypothetical protein